MVQIDIESVENMRLRSHVVLGFIMTKPSFEATQTTPLLSIYNSERNRSASLTSLPYISANFRKENVLDSVLKTPNCFPFSQVVIQSSFSLFQAISLTLFALVRFLSEL